MQNHEPFDETRLHAPSSHETSSPASRPDAGRVDPSQRFRHERFPSIETRAFASVLVGICFAILSTFFIAISDVLGTWTI